MKSKTFFTKNRIILIIIFISLVVFLITKFQISSLEFQGDLTYIDLDSSRISGLVFLKNKNLFLFNKENFVKNLLEINPEIEKIEVTPKNSSLIQIKIQNKEVCCVVSDLNTNKYLISHDGKVIKKLIRDQNYPHEISLEQELTLDSQISIDSLKKIVEIENVLLNKEIEITEIKIEGDRIEFKLISGGLLVLDSETNTKNFIEKLSNMLTYFKQKNLSFNKMDFRFGNVVVE